MKSFEFNYKGKKLYSKIALREEIFKEERKAFGNFPEDEKELDEFLKNLNVTYTVKEILPSFEEEKSRKKQAFIRQFNNWKDNGSYFISSLGFEVDSDSRSMLNISYLYAPGKGISFRDHQDVLHQLTPEQAKVLYSEVGLNNTDMYIHKWNVIDQITNAKNMEELNAIDILIKPNNYTKEESPEEEDVLGI